MSLYLSLAQLVYVLAMAGLLFLCSCSLGFLGGILGQSFGLLHLPICKLLRLSSSTRGRCWRLLSFHKPPATTRCHGPLPIVNIGTKELTFEPHSTQDLGALADVNLLWNARCSPACKASGCVGIGNPKPRYPTPQHPQPQPRSPAQECLCKPRPGLGLQTLARSEADRLGEPSPAGTPLALGSKDPRSQPRVTNPGESTRREPMLGKAGGALGKAAEMLGKIDGQRRREIAS